MNPTLTHWESFYVIVGSSAAALTGLQFVVITLIADSSSRIPTSMRQIAAFGTPTVVHFCSLLLIGAIVSSPWHTTTGVAWALSILGLAGLLYAGITVH